MEAKCDSGGYPNIDLVKNRIKSVLKKVDNKLFRLSAIASIITLFFSLFIYWHQLPKIPQLTIEGSSVIYSPEENQRYNFYETFTNCYEFLPVNLDSYSTEIGRLSYFKILIDPKVSTKELTILLSIPDPFLLTKVCLEKNQPQIRTLNIEHGDGYKWFKIYLNGMPLKDPIMIPFCFAHPKNLESIKKGYRFAAKLELNYSGKIESNTLIISK